MAHRDAWLAMDDAALLANCHVDAYRASGPGGQKRNKTSSAIRLRHKPSGLMVISEESRSQHGNRRTAVHRLRLAIAIELRPTDAPACDPASLLAKYVTTDGRLRISERNPDYVIALARVLDFVFAARGSIREFADLVGVSSSQLVRFLATNDGALARVNQWREQAELPRLRRP